MPRKNGCPFSVRNWLIQILSRASTPSNPVWLTIKGLTSMERSVDSDTEDGSSADSIWGEPYVTKRNGSITLSGKPASDAVTGDRDLGQAELDHYVNMAGCDGDVAMRIIDPYGHAVQLDVIVTGSSKSADDSSEEVSWDLEQVGEATDLPYIQATGVATTPATSVSVAVGETETVTVAFTPENASNQKYSVASADPGKVRVANIDGLTFDLVGVAATSSPVNVLVKTMNNALTATLAVTVTA